jgi:hypothetical protein
MRVACCSGFCYNDWQFIFGYVWGIIIFCSRKLEYCLTKEMYGKGQCIVVSTHCIDKAFAYANGSSVNHETFLTCFNLHDYIFCSL